MRISDGVQTCALPISSWRGRSWRRPSSPKGPVPCRTSCSAGTGIMRINTLGRDAGRMFIRLPTLRAWLLLAALGWLAGCATPPSDPPADSTAALLGGRMPTVVDIEAQLVEGNYQAVKTTAGRLLDGDHGNAKVGLLG